MRMPWGVGLFLSLLFAAPVGAQEPPRESAISGRIDLRYVYRDGAIEEARGNLDFAATPLGSTGFIAADVSISGDFDLDCARLVLELERLPYRAGGNLQIGNNGALPIIGQAYIEAPDIVHGLTARVGQFDFAYRLRPYADPFLFDSRAEPFFSGATPAFVRTTADRDLNASAGLRLQYDAEIAVAEFALLWRDQQIPLPPSAEEMMAILYLNALASERTALFVLAALAAGPGTDAEVWTVGAGVDQYFGPVRTIEAFAEAYFQFGRISPTVGKRAWALQAGTRAVAPCGIWGEAAFVYRSGDRDPADRRDQTFQSAERTDRFLIVESAEFGMDWDTNVRSLQLGAGYPVTPDISTRLDAGWFVFNQGLVDPLGSLMVGKHEGRIGIEVDGAIAWSLNDRVRLTARGGALGRSQVLKALTADGSQGTWVATFGVDAGF